MTASESVATAVSCGESVGVSAIGSGPRTISNFNKFGRCSSMYDDNLRMIGPEFIKRCQDPPISLNLHSELSGNRLTTVVCLNGQRLEVKYHPQRATVNDVFTLVVEHQKLKEKYLFGLAQLKGDEFVFLELESKLSKHLNANRFLTLIDDNAAPSSTLYLRVKFYVDGELLRYPSTKNLFYLQLRKDIVECRILCDVTDAVILASFALQCEYGDFPGEEINYAYYVPRLLTERHDFVEIVEQMKAVYCSHRGMPRIAAKQNFIDKTLLLPEYGFHFYAVLQEKQNLNSQVFLGICPRGISVFDNKSQCGGGGGSRLELQNFPWKSILRFTFDKCQFLVALQNQSLRHRIVTYQFYTHQHDLCKYLFNLASSHHRFYLRFELRSQESLFCDEVPHGSLKSNLDRSGLKNKRGRKTKLRSQSMLVLNDSKSRGVSSKAVRTLTRYDKAKTFSFPKRIKCRLLPLVFKSQGTYTVDEPEADVEVANNENISALLSEATGTINSCLLNETRSPSLNLEESINESLAHRFDNMTGIEIKTERRITAVSLKRDFRNSLGITIMKGADGAAYVKAAKLGASLGIHPGDRILAVNGKSVQSLCFSRVVEMIRNCGGSVELVLSQTVQHPDGSWRLEDKREAEVAPRHKNSSSVVRQACSELISSDEQRGQTARRPHDQSPSQANEGRDLANDSDSQTGLNLTAFQCDYVNGHLFADDDNLRHFDDEQFHRSQKVRTSLTNISLPGDYVTDDAELMFASDQTSSTQLIAANVAEMNSLESSSYSEWTNRPPICVYDYIHLFLKQLNGDFGFQLKSGYGSDGDEELIMVESVVDQLQQRIKPGDVILEVGGKSVAGLSVEQVVQLLNDTPQVVHLAIKRRAASKRSTPTRVKSEVRRQQQHVVYRNRNSEVSEDSVTNIMVSKHEQASKDSLDSDYSLDTTSSISSPDFEESGEPKSVVWQRSISGSVKARISDIESQAKKTAPRFSFNAKGGLMPKFSSLDRPPVIGGGGDDDVEKAVEVHSAVKSRTYRPHHSAQLLRSKTMPSVVPPLSDGLKDESEDVFKMPVPTKRSFISQPMRTSWSSPRATSIDEGSQNFNYAVFESMGVTRSALPVRKSFNNGTASFGNSGITSNGWMPKSQPLLLRPEATSRVTRSLTPECPPLRPPLVRQNNADFLLSPTADDPHPNNSSVSDNSLSPTSSVIWDSKLVELRRKFPFINERSVFKVILEKNSRGLGIGICGGREHYTADWSSIFIRIKRLYPLQPALESGLLKVGDIVLRVNEHHLVDLGHNEAVEALRVAAGCVNLLICRPLPGVMPPMPTSDPSESQSLRSFSSVTHFNILNAMSGSVASSYSKEFEVELEKCGGSLGFTLVGSANAHESGHFIKDLRKDPALSDGRLKPGDQILKVNDVELMGLSHEEAIQCLRNSPSLVKLLLCRQPDSPSTPIGEEYNERTDKKVLRKEAQDLLFDKIRRKSFESNSNSSSSSGRRQRLKGYGTASSLSVESPGDHSTPSNSDVESRRSTPTPTDGFRVPNVRSFLSQEALDAVDTTPGLAHALPPIKPSFLNLEPRTLDRCDISPGSVPSLRVSTWDAESLSEEPQLRSSETPVHAYVNGDNSKSDSNHLSPSSSFRRVVSCDGVKGLAHSTPKDSFTSAGLKKWRGAALDNGQEKMIATEVQPPAWELLAVELLKNKNDRLGFTLLPVEIGNLKGSFIRVVHPGGLAKSDGRLQAGDRLLKVNGVSVADIPHADVIELLRKQHGRISLEIARHPTISSSISNLVQLSLV